MLEVTLDIRDVPFEELKSQWEGLLCQFANSRIPGVEREDIYQELLVRLWHAQQSFDPTRGFAFSTYLHQSFSNKLGQLNHKENGVKKRVPAGLRCSLENARSLRTGDRAADMADLLTGFTAPARSTALYILGMSEEQPDDNEFEQGLQEIVATIRRKHA